MRKISSIIAVILLFTTGLLFAWDGFTYVRATENNSGILVEWQVKNEKEIGYYEIYRSRSDSQFLKKVASVTAIGNAPYYSFKDDQLFSKSAASGDYTFDYFIRAVMSDSGEYFDSDKVQASLTTLGVTRQTWGSIKAMFR